MDTPGGSRDGEKRSLAEAKGEHTPAFSHNRNRQKTASHFYYVSCIALSLFIGFFLFSIFIITLESENLVTIIHGKIESVAGG